MADPQAPKILILFVVLVLLGGAAIGAVDGWLYWRHGTAWTFSHAIGLTGRGAPLFVAALTIPAALGAGFLLSHWWHW